MSREDILTLSAQIVSAHLQHNKVAAQDVSALIQSVYSTLDQIDAPAPESTRQEPAVPIKKSVFADYVVCLEDGKKLKMLKRHLQTAYGMSPEQYREKWKLSKDYPMVAPNYAAQRSKLAKTIGLGRKSAADKTDPSVDVATEVSVQKFPARTRGRKSKVQEVAADE